MDKLTEALMGDDFGVYGFFTPAYYESKITGNRYSYSDYVNHGCGGYKMGYMDLPKDEYPYKLIHTKKIWKV